MKKGFYPKLAFDGIRKNKKMYLPYILTSIGMVMMYYIIIFLQFSQSIKDAVQSSTVSEILGLGEFMNFPGILMGHRNFLMHLPFLHKFVSYQAAQKGIRTLQHSRNGQTQSRHNTFLGNTHNSGYFPRHRPCCGYRFLEACRACISQFVKN